MNDTVEDSQYVSVCEVESCFHADLSVTLSLLLPMPDISFSLPHHVHDS